MGAGGDDDRGGLKHARAGIGVDAHPPGRHQTGVAVDHGHSVAFQVRSHPPLHHRGHPGGALAQDREGGGAVELEAHPVHLALAEPADEEGGLAQRLGGNPAAVDHHTPESGRPLDHRYPVSKVGGVRRRLLPRRPSTDDHQVVGVSGRSLRH